MKRNRVSKIKVIAAAGALFIFLVMILFLLGTGLMSRFKKGPSKKNEMIYTEAPIRNDRIGVNSII